MKGGLRILASCIALALVLSVFSIAAGSGSGGTRTSPPLVDTAPKPVDCESYSSMKERIGCRLENGNQRPTTHESCRGLANEKACQALYDKVFPCYDSESMAKDRCLRKIAGVTARLSSSNVSSRHNYALFLLYDLEERVEEAFEYGKISSEKASTVETYIISAKKAILEGLGRDEIRSRVATLKANWPKEVN